jgi:2-keto-4-pentenoate hydratase/2-oxohepta-3-ene-1,7-dioic acid hydratase in catechol pathway
MWLGRVWWRGTACEVRRDEEGIIWDPGGRPLPAQQCQFLPPSTPTKIVCVGRNYLEHAKELGNAVPERPLLFLKPPSAVLAPGGSILIPPDSSQVEYEGEIAVVISKTMKNLGPAEDPLDFVAGITPLNDVTARDLQRLDVQFTRAKSFDTFCPFGPWIIPVNTFSGLRVRTLLNGVPVQDGCSDEMAFPISELLRFISRAMTLCPGDVVATGTPSGVGRLSVGDRVTVQVGDVRLENPVDE